MTARRASPSAPLRSSTVRAAADRGHSVTGLNRFAIGFRSGLYAGSDRTAAPADRTRRSTAAVWVAGPVVSDDNVPLPRRRNEAPADVGLAAGGGRRPVARQAGPHRATPRRSA